MGKTIRENLDSDVTKSNSDVTKPKVERQSSAVIEYKPQKSVEELAEEGAKFVESDEFKEAQKAQEAQKKKKEKDGKKKKNKVSFQDENKTDKTLHDETEKKDKKDKSHDKK